MRFPRSLLFAAAAVVGLSTLAYALTVPPTVALRRVPWQTTTHYRWTFNYNDITADGLATGLNKPAVRIGAVPAKAFVSRVMCYVTNAWQNLSTTNNYLGLATTSAGTFAGQGDWLNGITGTTSSCVLTTAGYQNMTTAASLGMAVTSAATPTGVSGGWDIFGKVFSAAGTSTVGAVTVVFEYVPDDDN